MSRDAPGREGRTLSHDPFISSPDTLYTNNGTNWASYDSLMETWRVRPFKEVRSFMHHGLETAVVLSLRVWSAGTNLESDVCTMMMAGVSFLEGASPLRSCYRIIPPPHSSTRTPSFTSSH